MKIHEIITEGTFTQLLKKAADWVGSKIASAVNLLGFGKSITISLNDMIPNTMNENTGGKGARGSTSEVYVTYYLASILHSNGFNVVNNLSELANKAKGISKKYKFTGDGLKLIEETSKATAEAIYQDILNGSNSDIIITTFKLNSNPSVQFSKSKDEIEVGFVGSDTQDVTKADISITITKSGPKPLSESILLSLKNQEKAKFSTSNIHMIKILYWLFVDPNARLSSTPTSADIKAIADATGVDFVEEYREQIKKLRDLALAIKKEIGKMPQANKNLTGKRWKETYDVQAEKVFAELFVKVFNGGKNKGNTALMCRGLRTAMGMNNQGIYLAICETLQNGSKIYSSTGSKISPNFKLLIDALDNECDVSMTDSGTSGKIKLALTHDNKVINNVEINIRVSNTAASTPFTMSRLE